MKACFASLHFFLCFGLCAQQQSKPKLDTAKIITRNGTITGASLERTDSTIAVVDMKLAKPSVNPTYHAIEVIPVADLIKIRRTGSRPEDDIYTIESFSSGYYAISGALTGGAIGGAFRVVVGSGKQEIQHQSPTVCISKPQSSAFQVPL